MSRPHADRPRALAGAPISWGVCEVPDWGPQLAPEQVLGEMAALGLRATELGPIGWLPLDGAAVRAQLERHGLRLVGGFVPMVVHEPRLAPTRARVERVFADLAAGGAEIANAALVADDAWAEPFDLDADAWARAATHLDELAELARAHGLELALHPHVGTLVESADQIARALDACALPWCLDTGHLMIGGVDPAEFARRHGDRVVHVHLKDVDAGLAARLRGGELTFLAAVLQGLFRPLGTGDARITEVVAQLDAAGYARWLVLEQDTALHEGAPSPGADVRASIEFLA